VSEQLNEEDEEEEEDKVGELGDVSIEGRLVLNRADVSGTSGEVDEDGDKFRECLADEEEDENAEIEGEEECSFEAKDDETA